jgi:hypothetical protein
MWEGLLGGDWPEGSTFAFEALSCPCVTCLSDVEGGGLLADGSNLDAASHLGIRHVYVYAF